MELAEFASMVPGFDGMGDREKVRHFGWYLHSHCKMQVFATGDVRKCFEELRLVPPNVSLHLIRMADAKPPSLIGSKGKYKLHRREMTELDGRYAAHPTTIAASKLLTDLPAKVPDLAERAFLEEAINCYKVRAYRAAIVMTWNLAYDHLIRWIFTDPARMAALNVAFAKRFQKKPHTVVLSQDLEDIKEFDVIESCGTAGLVSSNVVKILREKLTKRNMAAHPSGVVVIEPQANDVITDLVNNVVLALK
jgi:hypothetical protein